MHSRYIKISLGMVYLLKSFKASDTGVPTNVRWKRDEVTGLSTRRHDCHLKMIDYQHISRNPNFEA